jgi:hypothetical protein
MHCSECNTCCDDCTSYVSCAALCVAHRTAFTAGAAFHAIVAPCRPPHRLIRLSAASAALLIAADEPTASHGLLLRHAGHHAIDSRLFRFARFARAGNVRCRA